MLYYFQSFVSCNGCAPSGRVPPTRPPKSTCGGLFIVWQRQTYKRRHFPLENATLPQLGLGHLRKVEEFRDALDLYACVRDYCQNDCVKHMYVVPHWRYIRNQFLLYCICIDYRVAILSSQSFCGVTLRGVTWIREIYENGANKFINYMVLYARGNGA